MDRIRDLWARAWVADAICLTGLALLSIAFAIRWTSQLDIRLYDETTYLERGLNVPNGLPTADMAPVYALWYQALSWFAEERTTLYFLNYGITLVLIPILTFLLLRTHGTTRGASLLAALFIQFTALNLFTWPRVSALALTILMIGAIITTRVDDRDRKFTVAVLAAGMAVFVRPEFLLALLILVTLWSWEIVKDGAWPGRLPLLEWSFVLACLIGLFITFGNPLANGRGLIAFGQHYALNRESTQPTGMDPWTNWEEVIENDLGPVQSIREAMFRNPEKFAQHVGMNLALTPSAIGAQLLPYWSRPVWYGFVLLTLLVAQLLYLGVTNKAAHGLSHFRSKFTVAFVLPALVSVIIIHPRAHYLLVLLVFAMITLVSRAYPEGSDRPRLCKYAPMVVLPIFLFLPNTRPVGPAGRPVLATIRSINALSLQDRATVLDADGGYTVYMHSPADRVTAQDKAQGFNAFLRGEDLDLIVATPRLMEDHRYREDEEWQRFVEGGHSPAFRKVPVEGTEVLLFVSERILASP
ncbi:MAG: hypothetical protein KDC00_07035 [Flavobacteriales bacterium]|nr:hypothetical protein [Flavobacteriales bacterium]